MCGYCASPGICALPLRRNGAHARFSIQNANALRFKAKALPVDCHVALDLDSSPDCHDPCRVCDLLQSSIHTFIPFIIFDYEASMTSGLKTLNYSSAPNLRFIVGFIFLVALYCTVSVGNWMAQWSDHSSNFEKKAFTQSLKTQASHSKGASSILTRLIAVLKAREYFWTQNKIESTKTRKVLSQISKMWSPHPREHTVFPKWMYPTPIDY